MSKVPIFPAIDGCDRMGEPEVWVNTSESKGKDGKVTSKQYCTYFRYNLLPNRPGKFTISGVRLKYRGHTVTAPDVTFTLEGSPVVQQQDDSADENVAVYENPFTKDKSMVRTELKAVRVYSDRTEVDVAYTSKGENVWVSSNYYIRDIVTKENVKLRRVRGDVGFDKKFFRAGTKLNFTLIFPPIADTWRNVDIIENVQQGMSFYGVGLAAKPSQDSDGAQITLINWSDARKVELNNYSSDFLFTDGMLPIYNEDLHKWGFFDEKGNLVVPFEWDFETFGTPHFGGGYCVVCKYRRVNGFNHVDYYSIDKTGKGVKLLGVEKTTPFCDGYAVVKKKGGKCVYINGRGQEVFPALVSYITNSQEMMPMRKFCDGLSVYYDYKKKLFGFINRQGQRVIPARYEDVHDFCEGLAAVKLPASSVSASKWGFINTKGEMAIPAQFTYEPSSFSLGTAVVTKQSGAEVMIDKSGRVVSQEFESLFPFFSTGYALAQLLNSRDYYVIDNNYVVVAGPVYGIDANHKSGGGTFFGVDKHFFWEGVKHRRYPEYNGAFQLPIFGSAGSYTYLTNGSFLFSDYRWKQMGQMSENLIHFKSDDGDGFIDYKGNVVFLIGKSEF